MVLNKDVLFGLCLLIASLLIVSYSLREGKNPGFLREVVFEAFTPFQKGSFYIQRSLKGVWEDYLYLVNLRRKNASLKKRVLRLEKENNELRELAIANKRLRSLLSLKKRVSLHTICATIIAQDPSPWFQTVLIDKGRADGIKEDMAVVVSQGIVGRVKEVSEGVSKVFLLTDPNSSIDAIIQRNRVRGIASGKRGNLLELKYVSEDEDVQIGDQVISSGMEGIFPKGFPIGKVKSIKKGVFPYMDIEIVPSSNLRRIEEVLVILRKPIEEDG